MSATLNLTNGTAKAPDDYTNTPITVTFATAQTSQIVNIPIINDNLLENTETLNLSLSNPTGGATIGSQNNAILNILDDDVQLNFSAANYTVREDGTAVTQIIITRTGNAAKVVGGTITFTDSTATGCSCGPTSASTDFYNGALNFTLAANETSKIIPVESATLNNSSAIRIRNDGIVEGSENFTINLTNPTNGATIGNQSSATVTILDDDTPIVLPIITITANTNRVTENGSNLIYTFTRTGDLTNPLTINLTVGGTAIFGTDYTQKGASSFTPTSKTITFAATKAKATLNIDPIGDSIVEPDKTFTLSLTSGTDYTIGTTTTFTATLADDEATDGNDTLIGSPVNDILDGKAGNDTMIGAAGNDTYTVDSTGDVVTENPNEGTDTVNASVTWTPANHIENLTLTGTNPINGTGNSLNNTLKGNSSDNQLTGLDGNDKLDGGLGNDTLDGGKGNDSYTLNAVRDVVIDSAGIDSVTTPFSYDLSIDNSIENLTLTGTNPVNGTGNASNNSITGNKANNTLIGGDGNDKLNGGAGNDSLNGGNGNDFYTIDSVGDVISDSSGIDSVSSSVSFTLDSSLENLTLTGRNPLSGTGNALNNNIKGNNAVNTLTGGSGNDTLAGGSGNDVLVGGSGNDSITGGLGGDRFVYNSLSDAVDIITDFSLVSGDVIDLSALLDSIGYGGSNPIADSRVKLIASGTATGVQIDADGTLSNPATLLVTLNNVVAANLNATHFVF